MRNLSYRLPDGTLVMPGQKPSQPNLAGALQNQNLRSAKYRLGEGSALSANPAPPPPNLSSALRKQV